MNAEEITGLTDSDIDLLASIHIDDIKQAWSVRTSDKVWVHVSPDVYAALSEAARRGHKDVKVVDDTWMKCRGILVKEDPDWFATIGR